VNASHEFLFHPFSAVIVRCDKCGCIVATWRVDGCPDCGTDRGGEWSRGDCGCGREVALPVPGGRKLPRLITRAFEQRRPVVTAPFYPNGTESPSSQQLRD